MAIERVAFAPFQGLLRRVSFGKSDELDALVGELAPVCELDRDAERNLFQAALGNPNIIRIGTKCTVRLEKQAYAAGVVMLAISNPGFQHMGRTERHALLSPADALLTWSVGAQLRYVLTRKGYRVEPEDVLPGYMEQLPPDILESLTETQHDRGRGLFLYALAFVLLHELGHLKFGHTESTPENEKIADRFAAEWLSEAAFSSSGDVEADRLNALFGIAVALLWLTVFNVYFGPKKSTTHPEGYDRLSQVLDQVIDWGNEEEHQMVWYFVSTLLFIHMDSAGFDFDERDAIHMQGDPRDEVNYLIDRIARGDRKR